MLLIRIWLNTASRRRRRAYGISIANFSALFTSLILAEPRTVIRRVSRDFGTVRSTSQLANESRGIPSACVSATSHGKPCVVRVT
jgi:hypothetical protein